MTRFVGLLLFATGCAASRLPAKTAADIRSSQVSAAFHSSEKRIHYSELVYKVLWNETRVQDASFEGLWDMDAEIGRLWVAELRRLGLESVELEANGEARDTVESVCANAGDGDVGSQLNEAQRRALATTGTRYSLLWCARHYVVDVAMGVATLSLPGQLIIYDLTSGERVYGGHFGLGARVYYDESVREIEDNNMTALRELTAHALVRATDRQVAQVLRNDSMHGQ